MSGKGTGQKTVKLALVLSGAATGGAYEAGVVDFLLQALDQWESAREKNEDKHSRPWTVDISDIIGSSAGGITSTLAVAAMNSTYQPLPSRFSEKDKAPVNNSLFSTWVEHMDYSNLLSTSDLQGDPSKVKFRSIMNSNFIHDTAKIVLGNHGELKKLPSFAQNTRLTLTSTNITGIPYDIKGFISYNAEEARFHMRQHGDYTSFDITEGKSKIDKTKVYPFQLDLMKNRTGAVWKKAIDHVGATAGFPGGFPAVNLSKPISAYTDRLKVKPDWIADMSKEITYPSVDGGCIDNDPFDIAEVMMKRHGDSSPDMVKAIFLVSPFPTNNNKIEPITDNLSISQALFGTKDSLTGQSRFKRRFLVDEPSEAKLFFLHPMPAKGNIIATEPMGSFAGIIDKKLRLHDFMLGRVNCQKFLRETFTFENLESKDTCFDGKYSSEGKTQIIPLIGSATTPCQMPSWPSFSKTERDEITKKIIVAADNRFKKIADISLHGYSSIPLGGIGKWIASTVFGHVAGKKFGETVSGVLDKHFE